VDICAPKVNAANLLGVRFAQHATLTNVDNFIITRRPRRIDERRASQSAPSPGGGEDLFIAR